MITKDIDNLTTYTRKDAMRTFEDFLDYVLWVFGVKPEHWSYDKGTGQHFFDTFKALVDDYQHGINHKGWCDPLGDTFMELVKGVAKYRGQFFTPDSICQLMTGIVLNKAKKADEPKPCGVYGYRIIVNDPTCGSGRNLLSAKAEYANKTEEEQPYFVGEDIDTLCCKMTAINLCVHGCYGEVVCHDTLCEPSSLRFGYLINIGLRYGGGPSITATNEPMQFMCLYPRLMYERELKRQEKIAAMKTKADEGLCKQSHSDSKKQKHVEPTQLSLSF